jgi:hypothetical protein
VALGYKGMSSSDSIRHVRRSGNGDAHLLAKYGCENKMCKVLVNPPDLIVSTLAAECA